MKPEKYQGFNEIRTRDLRDTGATLDQLSCEATQWARGHIFPYSEMTSCQFPCSEMTFSAKIKNFFIVHLKRTPIFE